MELTESDREALAEVLAPELYEALMEVTADHWRQWRFLTDEARDRYRQQAQSMLGDALAPVVAQIAAKAADEREAEALSDLANEVDSLLMSFVTSQSPNSPQWDKAQSRIVAHLQRTIQHRADRAALAQTEEPRP